MRTAHIALQIETSHKLHALGISQNLAKNTVIFKIYE